MTEKNCGAKTRASTPCQTLLRTGNVLRVSAEYDTGKITEVSSPLVML